MSFWSVIGDFLCGWAKTSSERAYGPPYVYDKKGGDFIDYANTIVRCGKDGYLYGDPIYNLDDLKKIQKAQAVEVPLSEYEERVKMLQGNTTYQFPSYLERKPEEEKTSKKKKKSVKKKATKKNGTAKARTKN